MIWVSFFCIGRQWTISEIFICAIQGSCRRFPSGVPDRELVLVFKRERDETICISHQDNPHGTCEKKKNSFLHIHLQSQHK